eukprot:1194866-Prorocentrum_minimum.AAC.7
MYAGASCGNWIRPRNQCVAHGACSWESWMFTTLSGSEAYGRLDLTDKSPPDPLLTPSYAQRAAPPHPCGTDAHGAHASLLVM